MTIGRGASGSSRSACSDASAASRCADPSAKIAPRYELRARGETYELVPPFGAQPAGTEGVGYRLREG